jgi:hypothetical protein
MKVTRLYTGADGQSHFDDIEVETGKLQPGDGIIFRDGTLITSTAGIGHLDGSMSSTCPAKARSRLEMVPSDGSVPAIFFLQTILQVRAISPEM